MSPVFKINNPDEYIDKMAKKIYTSILSEVYLDGIDVEDLNDGKIETMEMDEPVFGVEEDYLEDLGKIEEEIDEDDLNYLSRVFRTVPKQIEKFNKLMDAKTQWESSDEDEILVLTPNGYRLMKEEKYEKRANRQKGKEGLEEDVKKAYS
ncbi:MAG: hypothetical protein ACLFS3_01480 [Candidatus Aenigmatarchaeota archaeon]